MDAELLSDIGERQPVGVALRCLGDEGTCHFADDAAPRNALLIKVTDHRCPVDAVSTPQRIDRRPFLVEVCQLIDVTWRQPSLDRV